MYRRLILDKEIRCNSTEVKASVELEVVFTDYFVSTDRIVEYSLVSSNRRADFYFISTDRRVELLTYKDESNSY